MIATLINETTSRERKKVTETELGVRNQDGIRNQTNICRDKDHYITNMSKEFSTAAVGLFAV